MSEFISYGYFFNLLNPHEGKYLVLPSGHNASDRTSAQIEAETDFEYCALYYSKDGGNTFIPFSLSLGDTRTLVVDKDSRFSFWIDIKNFELVSDIDLVAHFFDVSEFKRYQEHVLFNNAKKWLKTNYPGLIIETVVENDTSFFRITALADTGKKHSIENPDLITGIIQIYDDLNA